MSTTGSTITDSQIVRVKNWAISTAHTTVENWCNVALDPGSDPALRTRDRQKVAAKYNDLWPDPTEVLATSGTWVCPDGVTLIAVECFAKGGDGGTSLSSAGGGGGGGGAYARLNAFTVNPGDSYVFAIDGTGGDTWFDAPTTCLAKGGTPGGNATSSDGGAGGPGGNATGCIGDIAWSGGAGSSGTLLQAGAGGGGAGEDGGGGNALGTTAGVEGPFGGGAGGGVGAAGSTMGGAGGGAALSIGTPGTGASGAVLLFY